MNPVLELYDATGVRIASHINPFGHYVSLNTTLVTGGIYTVVASDSGNDETGSHNYNLAWQRLNAPCSASANTSSLLEK